MRGLLPALIITTERPFEDLPYKSVLRIVFYGHGQSTQTSAALVQSLQRSFLNRQELRHRQHLHNGRRLGHTKAEREGSTQASLPPPLRTTGVPQVARDALELLFKARLPQVPVPKTVRWKLSYDVKLVWRSCQSLRGRV